MKKINYAKLMLDIIMAIGFIFLLEPDTLGISVHERFGLLIAMMVIVHLLINTRMIKGLSGKLFNKKVPWKTRLGFAIDILLFICLLVIMISGVGISMTLFTEIRFGNQGFWEELHEIVSYLSIGLIGIHGVLHWKWFRAVGKGMIGIAKSPKGPLIMFYTIMVSIFVIAMMSYGISQVNCAQRSGHGNYKGVGGERNEVPSDQLEKIFTVQELAKYDGRNGNLAYISVDGIVYDVSNCFREGSHYTVTAGTDISKEFYEEHPSSLLRRYPIVGALQQDNNSLAEDEKKSKSPELDKGSEFTLEQLAQYDGKDGQKAYVAIDGVVYDGSSCFKQGEHHGVLAGTDLTQQFYSKHAKGTLGGLPVVGQMTDSEVLGGRSAIPSEKEEEKNGGRKHEWQKERRGHDRDEEDDREGHEERKHRDD